MSCPLHLSPFSESSMHIEGVRVTHLQVQRGFGDIPVLKSIANRFGASAFFNTVLVRRPALTAHC